MPLRATSPTTSTEAHGCHFAVQSVPPFRGLKCTTRDVFDGLALRLEMSSLIAEAIGMTFDLDDSGVVKEAVEDGGSGWDIADKFPPFFEGPVGGHESGFNFITAHDDLEEIFAGSGR